MDNFVIEAVKLVAVNFATWMVDNDWKGVYSEALKKRAWVNGYENKIYTFGSDLHYTELIKDHGKSLEELYDLFVESERKRLQQKSEQTQDCKVCGKPFADKNMLYDHYDKVHNKGEE